MRLACPHSIAKEKRKKEKFFALIHSFLTLRNPETGCLEEKKEDRIEENVNVVFWVFCFRQNAAFWLFQLDVGKRFWLVKIDFQLNSLIGFVGKTQQLLPLFFKVPYSNHLMFQVSL